MGPWKCTLIQRLDKDIRATKIEDAYPGFSDWSRNAYTSSWANVKTEGKIVKRPANYPFTQSHEAVDLGLTSGTKWATCNIGANNSCANGYYFAWGETTTKTKNTYYADGNSLWYGLQISDLVAKEVIDNDNNNLMPHYDAATVIWGGAWRTPTYEDIKELIDECDWTWTDDKKYDGANIISYGYYTIKSSNGNTITLPAAGCMIYSGFTNYLDSNYGLYWNVTASYNA